MRWARRFITGRQARAAAARREGDFFTVQFPLPLALFTGDGQPNAAAKAEGVRAVLTTAVGAVTYPTTDRITLRRLGAQVVMLDLTPAFYQNRAVATVGEWARTVVHDVLGRWADDRQLRLLVLVADVGRVPHKGFTDAVRGHTERAPTADDVVDAATALPERSAFPAWVSRRPVQAGMWQAMLEAVTAWHVEHAPGATIILDGPGVDGQHTQPIGLPPARCLLLALPALARAIEQLYAGTHPTAPAHHVVMTHVDPLYTPRCPCMCVPWRVRGWTEPQAQHHR